MRSVLAGSLGFALLVVAAARGEDVRWRPAADQFFPAGASAAPGAGNPPVVILGKPIPLATLGRPIPVPNSSAQTSSGIPADVQVTRASYDGSILAPPRAVVRGQSPDLSGPSLTPPPAGPGIPLAPSDPYACGAVTEPPPPAGHSYLGKVGSWFSDEGVVGKYNHFESDHGFDQFISPVTSPFLSEDPRSLTELRPIFIQQGTPSKNAAFKGGDIEYFGVQARLSVTDRLSLVVNKLGLDWIEPHSETPPFQDHVGFAEVWLGPKYTFYRCEDSGTVAAAGLTFQIPAGSSDVFQNTGTLSLEPYVSLAQQFGRSSYGAFDFMNTTGYTFGVDNQRTDYFFTNFHLDYNVAVANKIYPLVELNYVHYTSAGKNLPLGFEGRDLFNFGSTGVGGQNELTMALGARYKFNPNLETGAAYEFPLLSNHELLDYRVTLDVIFRY